MSNKLIDLIRRNRISSVEVSDALGKSGVLENIRPLNRGNFSVGEVSYICTWKQSNYALHEQIQKINANSVLFVDAFLCDNYAVLGDLIAKYVLFYGAGDSIVTNGYVRDAHRLIKENYPIWCRGVTPVGCSNEKVEKFSELDSYIKKQNQKFDGSIIVADDSGCVLIQKEQMAKLFDKLSFIELQEDIWYFCIDVLKLSTFEVICKKKYLENPDILPKNLKQRLLNYLKEYEK